MLAVLGRCIVFIALVVAGVVTYPQWRGPVTHAVPQLNQYLPPSQTATPVVILSPTPTATAAPAITPLPLITPPQATAAPTATPAPAPTPASVSGTAPWSASDCTWASSTLSTDVGLDEAEVVALRDGTDPRFPASDIPLFEIWVSDWQNALAHVNELCKAIALPESELTSDLVNFRYAVSVHDADALAIPGNATWDHTWAGNYSRLISLYEEIPA